MPIHSSRPLWRIAVFVTLLTIAPPTIWGQSPGVASVYFFPNINAADEPEGNPLVGKNGSLYGSTYEVPAVFQLVPPAATGGTWTYHTLAELPFQSIGVGGLTADEKGNLYGADQRNGFGAGRLFELTPPSETEFRRRVELQYPAHLFRSRRR